MALVFVYQLGTDLNLLPTPAKVHTEISCSKSTILSRGTVGYLNLKIVPEVNITQPKPLSSTTTHSPYRSTPSKAKT